MVIQNNLHFRIPILRVPLFRVMLYTILAGALTKNIVAMKEHLEGDLEKESSQVHVYPAITEAQRRKERELVSAEVG